MVGLRTGVEGLDFGNAMESKDEGSRPNPVHALTAHSGTSHPGLVQFRKVWLGFGRSRTEREPQLPKNNRKTTEPTKCPTTLSRAHKMTVTTVIAGQVMHMEYKNNRRTTVPH